MGFVKRRATTKEVKAQFLLDIKAVVEFHDIPISLIIIWDQTGIHYVPVGSWTMEKEGSKKVEIAAVDDKRQIYCSLCCFISWRVLTSSIDI